MTTTTLKRGDNYEGGLYVGTTKAGVEWVARANRSGSAEENFAKLCERFDATQTRKVTGIRSQNVIEIAERLHAGDVENSRIEARRTKITATTITAPRSFMIDLADQVRDLANDYACGDRTVAENCYNVDLDWKTEEAFNKRIAKSLRRWAAKLAR